MFERLARLAQGLWNDRAKRLTDELDGVVPPSFSRRSFLARSGLAGATFAFGADVSLELVVPRTSIPAGAIRTPIPDFKRMTDPSGKGFVGVKDPLGSGRIVVQSNNFSGYSEAHETMGTTRDLPNGSTHYVAFDWLYMKPADLVQTGRNLFYQVQMVGSPIVAISTETGELVWVTRDNTTMKRESLGKIPWGHWTYFVVGLQIGSSGMAEMWLGIDGWPDVSKAPTKRRTGQQTYQGDAGHNTIAQYSLHSKSGVYTGYWSAFTRAASAQRALELAR